MVRERRNGGARETGRAQSTLASLPRPSSLSPNHHPQPAAAPPVTSPFAASLSRLTLVDTSPPPLLGGDAPSEAGVSVGAVPPAPPALDATGASIQGWPLADGGGVGGGGCASGSGAAEAAVLPPPPPQRTTTGNVRGAPSILLPHQRSELVSHIAIDIGGSLIKLVYFSGGGADRPSTAGGFDRPSTGGAAPSPPRRASGRGGKLHFVKFETAKIDDCLAFIEAKGLHRPAGGDGVPAATSARVRFVATGGGAFRFADLFASRLGVTLEKEDEMECLVAGADFLLRAIRHEAFTYLDGAVRYSDPPPSTLHPYLLVNIGSGVSMLRVDGGGAFARVSGSSLGGGTFWGLVRLLTGVRSFDDMLDLCSRGDNTAVDMLVGDIYGRDRDYSAIGLTANTIASSFGRAAAADADLSSYAPADVAMAVCRMISYNIGHLAYLNAKRFGLSRVFFGGFFIRGHPYTMATISYAIRFWSGGEMEAHFLRHEGFLGAVGAFLKVHPMSTVAGGAGAAVAAAVAAAGAQPSARRPPTVPAPVHAAAAATTTAPPSSSSPDSDAAAAAAAAAKGDRKVRARFVERFSMGAPYAGGVVEGDPFGGVADKVSWVEQHVDGDDGEDGEGDAAAAAVAAAAAAAASAEPLPSDQPLPDAGDDDASHHAFDAWSPRASMDGTGVATLAGAPSSSPRAAARLGLHVGVLHYSPCVEPFPLLADAARYAPDTLDAAAEPAELAYWVGVLADQVPQVVAKAVASEGATPDATRRGAALGRALAAHFARLRADPAAAYGGLALSDVFELREECLREFGFVDVYARDKARETVAALGELPPLLSELDGLPPPARLEAAVQGALAANIFDWGARACVDLYAAHGDTLSVFRDARDRAARRPWRVDSFDLLSADWSAAVAAGRPPFARTIIFVDNAGADVVLGVLPLARELLRSGGDVILAANTLPALNDVTEAELRALMADVARADSILGTAASAGAAAEAAAGGRIPPPPGLRARVPSSGRLADMVMVSGATSPGGPTPGTSPLASAAAAHAAALAAAAAASTSTTAPRAPSPSRTPRLFVVGNGQGSPCLDLRRVPDAVADAAVGADFVILIGMGRAVHTNFSARFRCASLKLALVKNAHLARRLFGGDIMDCVCLYEYEEGVG